MIQDKKQVAGGNQWAREAAQVGNRQLVFWVKIFHLDLKNRAEIASLKR